jgi:hypothetical protein
MEATEPPSRRKKATTRTVGAGGIVEIMEIRVGMAATPGTMAEAAVRT